MEPSEESRAEAMPESKALTLEELVAGITPENRHDEISTGVLAGKETMGW